LGVETPWIPVGDRIRCTLHDLTFARTSTCGECEVSAIDFTSIDDVVELPPAPAGCVNSYVLEARFLANGDTVANAAREMIDGGEPDWSVVVKLIAESTKAYRAAGEMVRTRENDHSTERRLKSFTATKAKARH
jgi:hypothetical protein